MLVLMKTLRNEHETIVKLKALVPGNQIPQGLLSQGPTAIQSAIGSFDKAKKMDSVNEKWPKKSEKEKPDDNDNITNEKQNG